MGNREFPSLPRASQAKIISGGSTWRNKRPSFSNPRGARHTRLDPAMTLCLSGQPCLKSFILAAFWPKGVFWLPLLSVCQEQQPVKVISGLAWKDHEKHSPDKKEPFVLSLLPCGLPVLPAVLCTDLRNASLICPMMATGGKKRETGHLCLHPPLPWCVALVLCLLYMHCQCPAHWARGSHRSGIIGVQDRAEERKIT